MCQPRRSSVFVGIFPQTVAPIHSHVATSTFVFTVLQLSIRARVVQAPLALLQARNEPIVRNRPRLRSICLQHPLIMIILPLLTIVFPQLRSAPYVSTLGTSSLLTTQIEPLFSMVYVIVLSLFTNLTHLASTTTKLTIILVLCAPTLNRSWIIYSQRTSPWAASRWFTLNPVVFTLSAVYPKRIQENPAQLLTVVACMVFH